MVRNEDGDTALHLAILKNREQFVEILLHCGADVNSRGEWGQTPLHLTGKNLPIAKLLLDNDVQVNAIDFGGYTPLHYVAQYGKAAVAQFLIENGANINDQENQSQSLPCFGNSSPLHLAAISGNSDTTDVLIRYGADINAIDKHGATALHYAIYEGHIQTAKALTKNGAKIKQPVKDTGHKSLLVWPGATALHIAVATGRLHAVQFLVKRKAYIETKDKNGLTPFDIATTKGNRQILKYLYDQK